MKYEKGSFLFNGESVYYSYPVFDNVEELIEKVGAERLLEIVNRDSKNYHKSKEYRRMFLKRGRK